MSFPNALSPIHAWEPPSEPVYVPRHADLSWVRIAKAAVSAVVTPHQPRHSGGAK